MRQRLGDGTKQSTFWNVHIVIVRDMASLNGIVGFVLSCSVRWCAINKMLKRLDV